MGRKISRSGRIRADFWRSGRIKEEEKMKTIFNKTKVKSWIKKAYKDQLLAYGHGYITDGRIILTEEQHMQPAILEVFGTLTPKCKYGAEAFRQLMDLPDAPVEVIDSQLEYAPDVKSRLRIFYDPRTGRELIIDGIYFDLIDEPKVHRFCTNDSMGMLWIMYDDKVAGVVAPVRLREDKLSHIKFRVKEETEQV
jgi:hypothetical protein